MKMINREALSVVKMFTSCFDVILLNFGEKGKAADFVFSFPNQCASEFYSSLIVLIAGQGHCLGWQKNHDKCRYSIAIGFFPEFC